MAKRGRSRKAGQRWKNGRLAPEPVEIIPADAIARRAEVVGIRNALQPAAGYALGQLTLRGVVDQRQHDAGIAFRQSWLRWAALAGLPAHEVIQRFPSSPRDVDTAAWERARDAFRAACAVLKRCFPSGLVWAAVETIVMDNVLPPVLHERGTALNALRTGLTALADHYGLPASEKVLLPARAS